MNFLLEDNTKEAFRVLLQYYDKLYGKNLENNRENIDQTVTKLVCEEVNDLANAKKIVSCL